MLPVIWRKEASDELDEIIGFIAQFDEVAADRLEDAALRSAERLTAYPYIYRTGRVAGTREAVFHPNYLLVYRVAATAIEITSVIHTRRQYPSN